MRKCEGININSSIVPKPFYKKSCFDPYLKTDGTSLLILFPVMVKYKIPLKLIEVIITGLMCEWSYLRKIEKSQNHAKHFLTTRLALRGP